MKLPKNFTGACMLAAGVLAMAIPAQADTLVNSVGISQTGHGMNDSANLGAVNTVHCALTRVRTTDENNRVECYLMQVSGQWKLRARVEFATPLSPFVHCEAHCYQ